jgi:hypothetical protein
VDDIKSGINTFFFDRFNLASKPCYLVHMATNSFFLWPCYGTKVLNFEKYLATMNIVSVKSARAM